MSLKCICPECRASLGVNGPVGRIKCPKCGTSFKPKIADGEKAPERNSAARAERDRDDFDFDGKSEGKRKPNRVGRQREEEVENDRPTRHSRERDEDEERPTRKKRKGAAKKKSPFPVWMPISIGAAVVATVIIILIANSGSNGAKKQADDSKSDRPAIASNDFTLAQIPPNGNVAQNSPPKKDEFNQPNDEVAIRDLDANIQIPPLPPPDQRPVLVLDPGGHAATVKRVLFTPDGRQLITVSEDKTIRVWDVETGETVKTIHMPNGPGHEGALTSAAISPDGKTIVVSGIPMGLGKNGILVYVVSLESGQIKNVFKGHTQAVSTLSISPNGQWFASSSFDGTALVRKLDDGSISEVLKGHGGAVSQVAFNPKDPRVATSSHDTTARIWSSIDGKLEFKVLAGHTEPLNCLAWSPDGNRLATGGVDGTIRLWSGDGRPLKTYEKEVERSGPNEARTQITALAFTNDGKELLYTGVALKGRAGILNLETGERRVRIDGHSNTVMHGSLSPDSSLAVSTGGDEHETYIWKVADGSIVQKIHGGGKSVWNVGWSPDSRGILWGNVNSGFAIPPTTPIHSFFRLDVFERAKLPARFLIAQADLGGYHISRRDFTHLDVRRGGQVHYTFDSRSEAARIYCGTLVAGDRLIVGGAGLLSLVDLKEKRIVRKFTGHAGLVTSVAPAPNGNFFVTGSADQTIRIWRMDKDEPVLSLFFADREWIAWTPEGYYAASANGERLMGWQINNGIDKVGTFFPAVQFRQSLYQPDVIKNLFRVNGDLRDALALTIKEKKKPIGSIILTQAIPPEVKITSPAALRGDARIEQETFQVTATAKSTGNHPIRSLRLLVDGRPYLGQRGIKAIAAPKLGEVKADWNVSLTRGKHTLNVQAESAVSRGLSAPVELVQVAGVERLPNLYLLAVGVNDYPGRLKLNYASTDAQAITKVMREKTKGVFGKVEIKMILDKEATRAHVLEGLNWLEAKMTAQDVGIFFFSGHGGKDDEDNFYLVPVDVGLNIAQTGVPGELVKQKLSDMPGRMVAILDACHSGAAAESLQAGRADNLVRDLLTDDCGVVVLCSSLGDESSLESPETKAGFFTLGLVEGLNGKADFNKDGYIFIHEACLYAVLRVQQLSGGEQNPTLGRSPRLKPFALTKP